MKLQHPTKNVCLINQTQPKWGEVRITDEMYCNERVGSGRITLDKFHFSGERTRKNKMEFINI